MTYADTWTGLQRVEREDRKRLVFDRQCVPSLVWTLKRRNDTAVIDHDGASPLAEFGDVVWCERCRQAVAPWPRWVA